MNKDNVLAVADAIEGHTIPELGFYMGNFAMNNLLPGHDLDRSGNICGTVACIAGWSKRIRTGRPLEPESVNTFNWTSEALWLGLALGDAERLFYGQDEAGREVIELADVTPTQAATVLRHLAETGEVDWSTAK